MKKFISMVMAAAMVVSLVPATAFAANTAEFKVSGAEKVNSTQAENYLASGTGMAYDGTPAEIQIYVKDADTIIGGTNEKTFDLTLDFENIKLENNFTSATVGSVYALDTTGKYTVDVGDVVMKGAEADATSFELEVVENDGYDLKDGDVIVIPMDNRWVLTSKASGTVGTVTVGGDFGTSEAMTVIKVVDKALDITVAGKNKEIAEEEVETLKAITIKSETGNFDNASGAVIKVKLNKGFEFAGSAPTVRMYLDGTLIGTMDRVVFTEDDVMEIWNDTGSYNFDKLEILANALSIEAVSAKPGDIATLTVTHKGYTSDSDECAVVIADAVKMTVDEDADVPVMYAGVDTDELGLNSDNDHDALKVTIEESVVGAWDTVDKWTLSLPEGVTVVDSSAILGEGTVKNLKGNAIDLDALFKEAYKDGDYQNFEFGRRSFERFDNTTKIKIELELDLVADPSFVGDVVLSLTGDGVGEVADVTIAKFVAPFTVEAEANDLIIDYKETLVDSVVVITEAEAGLWDDSYATWGAAFALGMERIDIEDSAVAVDKESEMEIDDEYATAIVWGSRDVVGFNVEEESDEAAAVVTVSDLKLYMERSLPAGAYDLDIYANFWDNYYAEGVFAPATTTVADAYTDGVYEAYIAKEGFVNIITAGRDQDDSSFTTKIVVPVGEMYLLAGETTVALDVPAYISAEGYTMMPVRAVAVALGINTNSVLWDQATKTVTILYGNRVISMQVGSRVMYVGGTAVPTSAAPEVVDGRTFLPLRDLGTALGVTKFAYDPATKTASMN